MPSLSLQADRLFPSDSKTRDLARRLFERVERLPILSPHGHTDAAWFAQDTPFEDATSLLLWPDHYVLRLLYSQGVSLESLGMGRGRDLATVDRRAAWRIFAGLYHLFRGTPSRLWLDYVFVEVFGFDRRLSAETADFYYDKIEQDLAQPAFRPRALYDRFGIEVLATTEGALDDLSHHQALRASGWDRRIITTFRPDDVTDPDRPDFKANLERLSGLTGENTNLWAGYLAAVWTRRAFFRESGGAKATDHGHPTPRTADLPASDCQALLDRLLSGRAGTEDAELFRAQMLTELALMSCEDGMVMQIHPGSWRNHNPQLLERFGRDKGADMPMRTEYTGALKPMLDKVGNRPDLTVILFTLDESTYSRELAPLAGHYPCLRLGPSWWFHDSAEGMMRFRRQTTETAGFYNTVGFNDDTRAFLSIPARHDVARRIDCAYLAELVATHRLDEDEAAEVAVDLAYNLPKAAYRL